MGGSMDHEDAARSMGLGHGQLVWQICILVAARDDLVTIESLTHCGLASAAHTS